jgi:hypothetical protein
VLVGVIFSILVAYDELQRADGIDQDYRPAFEFYQKFQMALGIFEGLLIVTEMFAEFMMWTTVASACGPLMLGTYHIQPISVLSIALTDRVIVACVIGIVLVVWWYLYAKDMALQPIKRFLQNKAKPLDAFTGHLDL